MTIWSCINLSALGHALRIEADYYKPEYLELDSVLNRVAAVPLLRYLTYLTDGTHVTPKYVAEGIPFLSSSDVDPFILPNRIDKFISQSEHDQLKHCQPEANDILMSKSGRIGTCAVVPEYIKKGDWNIYEGIALLRIKDVSPHYITAFLNSKYGITQIRRELKGVAQPHLHLEDIRRLKVFIPTPIEEQNIKSTVLNGIKCSEKSYELHTLAQQILVSELGLDKLSFQKPMGYTAQFSELELSRRLDAQHYQAQFTQLLSHLAKFPNRKIRDIRTCNRRGIQPIYVNDGNFDVINSQHLGPKHINYDGLVKTSHRYFSASPVAHIRKNDLLIYTTGAYIGSTNVYLSDVPAFASNHVNILRITPEIDAAYMAMVLQSVVGQFQTQKHSRGSAQAELYPNDIDKFVVPILPFEQQKIIGDLVRESLVKQLESERLLEQAKTRVEQLIEEAVQA